VFDWVANDVHVHPPGPLSGSVRPPGSKSLTNRALICAALADGVSELRGASLSDDAWSMLRGLQALGVEVEVREREPTITVRGTRGHLPECEADIDAGNAGTTMRFLTALTCLGYGRYRLDGSARMRERPIGGLVDALHTLGAGIGYEEREGFPPLTIVARGLRGGEVVFRQPPSSQFLTAVLLVAPYAGDDVRISVRGSLPSRPYVDMTLDVMRRFGVEVLDDGQARFIVPAPQRYTGTTVPIEPDASAATYLWAAAAITGGRVRVEGLSRDSRQGDVRFVDLLEQMGCTVRADERGLSVAGPRDTRLRGIDVDMNDMPDAVQTLAVLALFADGPTTIRNVANLRIKETDRLTALATELRRVGADVAEHDDGLTIRPPARLRPATIETYDDHRMAMSFALCGLAFNGIVIHNADCVSKSFPDYFETLASLSGPARPPEGS